MATSRALLLFVFLFAGGVACAVPASSETPRSQPLDGRERALHVLTRLGYGPRPGEVDRVTLFGAEKWIQAQLRPETIEDAAAESAVASIESIHLPTQALVEAFQTELRERRERQQAMARNSEEKEQMTDASEPAAREAPRRVEPRTAESYLAVQALGDLQHAKVLRAAISERQLQEVLVDFWFNHFNVDARKQVVRVAVVPYERDVIRPHVFGTFRELLGATAQSAAMLVYLDNFRSSRSMTLGKREADAVRRLQREALGEEAPAETPQNRGLNENYGRELLELHTLGVDAGYTQKDVQEVARAFTGWTINPRTGAFVFRPGMHDNEAKNILGKSFASGGGRADGEKVLDLLASHPATARRIAYKLCQRFVADDPPEDFVGRVASAFTRSQGDLRATYQALFLDRAFFAPEHFGSKTKSPFEFVVSSIRATGGSFVEPSGLRRGPAPVRVMEAGASLGRGGDRLGRLPRKTSLLYLVEMGQPVFAWSPPTGFPEDSTHWISSGALINRLNFAVALSSGEVADVATDVSRLLGPGEAESAEALVDRLALQILGREPSEATRSVILRETASLTGSQSVRAPKIIALLVGSPEFQRR